MYSFPHHGAHREPQDALARKSLDSSVVLSALCGGRLHSASCRIFIIGNIFPRRQTLPAFLSARITFFFKSLEGIFVSLSAASFGRRGARISAPGVWPGGRDRRY